MADITKIINRAIPPNERIVKFTEADAGAGDILLVRDSLGKSASRVTIEPVNAMTVRFNVYHTVFPLRKAGDGLGESIHGASNNVSQGKRIKDDTNAVVDIPAGGTLELRDDVPVNDIEIITATGAFTIICL